MTAAEATPPLPDPRPGTQSCASWILLAAFVLVAVFPLLGSRGLSEPDEGRYSEMSREMLASGDWLVPTLHGFAHFQKPPTVYWLVAGSLTVFGHNEWAARFPCALAALGTAWLTFVTGRRLFGQRGGVAATVVLVTCLQFFILSHMLTPDMVLTFWAAAAMAVFVRWMSDPSRRPWLWAFFVAMGLGFLTKGPMAIVVPVSAAATWQIASRCRGGKVRIPWVRGVALTLVISVSWFLVVAIREPKLFHFFAHDELVARFFTKQHGRYHSPLFFIPVMLVGLLPWTFLLPTVVRWLISELKFGQPSAAAAWFMIGWIVPPFLLLSCSGSKLITYVLPLYPALALLIGGWWARLDTTANLTREAVVIAAFFGVVILALLGGMRLLPSRIPAVPLPVIGLLVLIVSGMAVLIAFAKPRPAWLGGGLAAGSLGVWILMLSQVVAWNDVLGTGASVRSLAQRIQSLAGRTPAVFTYGVNVPGLEWYLSRLVHVSRERVDDLLPMSASQQARLVSSPKACLELAPPAQPVFGVVKLRSAGVRWTTNEWELVASAGSYALIQRK